jgi:hypothetical protein
MGFPCVTCTYIRVRVLGLRLFLSSPVVVCGEPLVFSMEWGVLDDNSRKTIMKFKKNYNENPVCRLPFRIVSFR